jgi:hypothetical protein
VGEFLVARERYIDDVLQGFLTTVCSNS